MGDGQTDRHTHTHTFFLNTFLDSGSDVESKIIKKSKSNFLTIAILPPLLMSLESKNVTINKDINIENLYIRWTYG